MPSLLETRLARLEGRLARPRFKRVILLNDGDELPPDDDGLMVILLVDLVATESIAHTAQCTNDDPLQDMVERMRHATGRL